MRAVDAREPDPVRRGCARAALGGDRERLRDRRGRWPAPRRACSGPGSGRWYPAVSGATIAAAAVLAVALVIDATPLRRRMPLTKRQVNEDWMVTYRGWVYGIGFGAQLGLGFITFVACAAIYATFAIELLSGSLLAGVVIGAAFGATKAASLLPAGRARDRNSIVALHRRLLTAEPLSVGAVVVAEIAAAILVAGALA